MVQQYDTTESNDEYEIRHIDNDVVLTKGSDLIGAAFCTEFQDATFVKYLAIHEEYRDKGLGARLLQAVESKSMSDRRRRVMFFAKTNLVDWYVRQGYRAIACAGLGYYVMEKLLEYGVV